MNEKIIDGKKVRKEKELKLQEKVMTLKEKLTLVVISIAFDES